jgi:tellurite resistance-related uncharacterized protein
MIRSILAFHADPDGDWVAELSCFHNQHVRHRPPLQPREWVLTAEGRMAHIDSPIECPLCDRAEMPEDGIVLLRRMGPWDQTQLPDALRKSHTVPGGNWARLHVVAGEVGLQFHPDDTPPGELRHLAAGEYQPIPPTVPHRVVLLGPAGVELELELWGEAPDVT